MIFVSLIYFFVKSICNPNLTFQFIFSEDFLNDTNSTPRTETIVNQSSNQEKSDIEIPNDDAGAQDQTEQVPEGKLFFSKVKHSVEISIFLLQRFYVKSKKSLEVQILHIFVVLEVLNFVCGKISAL